MAQQITENIQRSDKRYYGELIDKDRTQSKALGCNQAFSGNLSMPIKDAFDIVSLKFSIAMERSL